MKTTITSIVFVFIIQTAFCQLENFPETGKIQPRSSHEIAASPWSVGGETMDRDYTVFENWKEHQKNGTHYTFKNIPVYDSPILIIEESLLKVNQ